MNRPQLLQKELSLLKKSQGCYLLHFSSLIRFHSSCEIQVVFFCLKSEKVSRQAVVYCSIIYICYRRNVSVRRNGSAQAKRFCLKYILKSGKSDICVRQKASQTNRQLRKQFRIQFAQADPICLGGSNLPRRIQFAQADPIRLGKSDMAEISFRVDAGALKGTRDTQFFVKH